MEDELKEYKGLIYYILYYEVLKFDLKIILVRIVFNSSVNYMGYILNDYWVKGFDLWNNIFGIFVRFCENLVVFIGDIKKMYYIVVMIILDYYIY